MFAISIRSKKTKIAYIFKKTLILCKYEKHEKIFKEEESVEIL